VRDPETSSLKQVQGRLHDGMRDAENKLRMTGRCLNGRNLKIPPFSLPGAMAPFPLLDTPKRDMVKFNNPYTYACLVNQ
jgi:hypothetical protein